MGIGVPISKVARGEADPSRKAAERRSSVPARPRSEARSIDAETRRGRQRSERAATERTGHRSEAATRSEGVPRATGKRRARRRHGVTRQRGATGKRGAAGSRTLRSCTMEGRSLDNPTRGTRLCGRVARTETRRESRRQGQEGRASQNESDGKRTDRGSSRAGVWRRTSRPRRAAVNGQGAATSIGVLPPAGGTCRMWWYGADHAPARERSIDRRGSLPRQQVPEPHGARRRKAVGTSRKAKIESAVERQSSP
jgi:hypothetical protein